MKLGTKILVMALILSQNAVAQNEALNNFTRYFYPPMDYLKNYGETPMPILQINMAHLSPYPPFPNDEVLRHQDSLCGKLHVKRASYRINKMDHETTYDAAGRVSGRKHNYYTQTQTYSPEGLIVKTQFVAMYASALWTMTYDKDTRLVKVELTKDQDKFREGLVFLEREYKDGKLTYSWQEDGPVTEHYVKQKHYPVGYDDAGRVIRIGDYTFEYEEPTGPILTKFRKHTPIYNMKGQLMECGPCKFNWNEKGLLKSYTCNPMGMLNQSSFTYDEQNRLIGTTATYGAYSYAYREDGLLNKIGDAKVKYEF